MEPSKVAPHHEQHSSPASYPDSSDNVPSQTLFEDLDDPNVFARLDRRARDGRSKNFVLDYSLDRAQCAFDLQPSTLEKLISEPRDEGLEYRWIHLFGPHSQQEVLKILQANYQFTPRLLGLMRSQPRFRRNLYPENQGSEVQKSRRSHDHIFHSSSRHSGKESSEDSVDPEKAAHMSVSPVSSSSSPIEEQMLKRLNHYDIVDSIWHWSSVDFGHKYLCAGYNSLYNIKSPLPGGDEKAIPSSDMPNGDRVWNWLILCNDKTVISITEGTVPPLPSGAAASKFIDRSSLRRNMLNVFNQMSKVNHKSERNPISIVPIRYTVEKTIADDSSTIAESSSLLFYYLFDDWYSTYSLLARREHLYKATLNELREKMIHKANLQHVHSLHRIGRQLSVLKRLYQSYDLVIERILEKQTKHSALSGDTFPPPSRQRTFSSIDIETSLRQENLGVYLSSDAQFRFERLKDRIKLYAISEIQESIELKDSLVGMNFNLITIKESNSVEKLTRITILLAKATILFLPVSLMTAYFSTQITDTRFTVKSYWISFAVILVVSFFGLLIFGKISGTTEGNMVYEPIYQILFNIFRKTVGRLFGNRRHQE